MRKSGVFAVLAVLSLVALSSGRAEHPWPKPGRDLANTSFTPLRGPSDNEIRWVREISVGQIVRFSPIIDSSGTVFVASRDGLAAIGPDNTLRWTCPSGGEEVWTSPALGGDGTIYFACGSRLYALSPDGTQRWVFNAENLIVSCPVVGPDGTVYFGTFDNWTYALTPRGNRKWRIAGAMFQGAAVDNEGILYFGVFGSELLQAVDPSGNVLWSVRLEGRVWSAPSLSPDGTIWVGTEEGMLYAYGKDGSQKLSVRVGEAIRMSPALGQGAVYVCAQEENGLSQLVKVLATGQVQWRRELRSVGSLINAYSTPAVDGGGRVYVGSDALYAFGPDGELLWKIVTGSPWSSPAIGPGGLLCAGSGGFLYVIGKPPEERNRFVYLIPVAIIAAGLCLFLVVKRKG
ncbi:MAG: PQQ-binding-like beta-propeller repeat protein [Candidatus Hadarchaeales archaeon]